MAQNVDNMETEHLFLRGINETDTDSIVEWRSDSSVYKYFKYPHKISSEEHLDWYRNIYLSNSSRFDWMCYEKKSHRRVGVFGLIRNGDTAEVNYLLAPEAQHKGFASEAVKSLMQYAVQFWHVKSIVAEIHKSNYASISLIKKLDFKLFSTEEQFEEYRIEVQT